MKNKAGKLTRLLWWLQIVRLSLRWIPSNNIGDQVWYKGEKWTLIHGACRPTWDLTRGDERIRAREGNFTKVRSLSNYKRSFMSGYRFYMTNWYDIWCRKGVEDWMRGCNIWADKRPL